MIDAAVKELIERQIRRDGRSLLQYVGESFPYTPPRSEHARAQVTELAREEQEAIGRFIPFMHRHHVSPPVLGAYPSNFTTINFVALDHLLPGLLKEQQYGVAELERALASFPASDARQLLREYLDMKRRHLRVLQEIAGIEHAH